MGEVEVGWFSECGGLEGETGKGRTRGIGGVEGGGEHGGGEGRCL